MWKLKRGGGYVSSQSLAYHRRHFVVHEPRTCVNSLQTQHALLVTFKCSNLIGIREVRNRSDKTYL